MGAYATRVACAQDEGKEGGSIKSSLTVPPLKLRNKKTWLQYSVGDSVTCDIKYLPTWTQSAEN